MQTYTRDYKGMFSQEVASGMQTFLEITFQTPFGTLHLVTLPMEWTKSVPIFHDVTYILKDEIPHFTV